MQYITLNNDVKMPAEGLGTFLMSPADAEMATLNALRAGFHTNDAGRGSLDAAGFRGKSKCFRSEFPYIRFLRPAQPNEGGKA